MNRIEYMRELGTLLQGMPKEEREEALQYYNDYFDDAGSENEEKIIRELGSPKKLAETILAGVGGETADSEAYGEYGERGYRDSRFDTSDAPVRRDGFYGNENTQEDGKAYSYAGNEAYTYSYTGNKNQKKSTVWKVILIICILVIGVPIVIPVAGGLLMAAVGILIGIVAALAAVVFGGVAVAIAGIVVGVFGVIELFHFPVIGIGMIGGGCLMLAAGAVLTVLIAWICIKLIPPMFRGLVNLCRMPFKNKRGGNV